VVPHFTKGMKKTEAFDHYGHLNEILELSYNDKTARIVVLFSVIGTTKIRRRKEPPKMMGISHPSILKLSGRRRNCIFWQLKPPR
jgi:hypothetical protein